VAGVSQRKINNLEPARVDCPHAEGTLTVYSPTDLHRADCLPELREQKRISSRVRRSLLTKKG
jgi:hypothetical protein